MLNERPFSKPGGTVMAWLEPVAVGVLGFWAGIEVVVCYVVRGSLTGLEPAPHIRLRQALIRRLRVLVPAVFLPATVLVVCLAVADGIGQVPVIAAIAAWAAVTFGGTVPLNQRVLEWRPDALPSGWPDVIARWERLDVVRCWAVVAALVLALVAAG
jgi:hypothetical protein